MSISKLVCICGLSLTISNLACEVRAEGPEAEAVGGHNGKIVWEEDFSDPNLPPWSTSYYAPPGGKKGRPAIAVKEGDLHFSSLYLAAPEIRGYASATYHFKNGGAGFKLIEAPMLEIRLRPLLDAGRHGKMSVAIILNYVTYGGTTMWTSLSPWELARAGEWVEVRHNLYDHPIASGPGGKKLLTGINFFLQTDLPGKPTVALEVDWMRLRRMTREEYDKLSVYESLLTDFRMERTPRAESFFGLGFYGLNCPRWGGGWPVTLDGLARDWVNFIGPASGRFYQNVWHDHRSVVLDEAKADLPEGEEARATVYVRTHKYLAALLREYDISYLANMVGFAGGVATVKLVDRDRDQLDLWADEIADGLRDEPNILGWFCADEAKPTYLRPFLITKSMLESRDRTKPAMVLVNNLGFLAGYDPSHQVVFTDQYPVLRPGRDDPWLILKWMTDISKLTGDKPHWFTTQSFYTRKEHWWARPGPAGLRLMSWLAVAGGANINCYFLLSSGPWWQDVYIRNNLRGDPFWCTMDCYGNETPRYRVFREYAAKIGPIGSLLARAKLVPKPRISAVSQEIKQNGIGPDATRTIKAVHVGVLRPAQMDCSVLIVVNMDRDRARPTTIAVPDAGDKRVYDLVNLREIPAARPGTYELLTLQPGDGHPFILCSARTFEEVKRMVTAARASHAVLVAKLDLRLARVWEMDVAKFERQLLQGKKMLADGRSQKALKAAEKLRAAVNRALKAHAGYSECQGTLEDCRKKLGQIEVMLNVSVHGENPTIKPELRALAKEVLAASQQFNRCMRDFYAGRKTGLPQRASTLQDKVAELLPDISRESGVTPDHWPFPEKPWLHK